MTYVIDRRGTVHRSFTIVFDGVVPTGYPEWRPVETAPKDGTTVLLGRFADEPKSAHGYIMVDWYRDGMTYWPPTHWMPLPPAPVVKSSGQDKEC